MSASIPATHRAAAQALQAVDPDLAQICPCTLARMMPEILAAVRIVATSRTVSPTPRPVAVDPLTLEETPIHV
jgi:hypothetical protein